MSKSGKTDLAGLLRQGSDLSLGQRLRLVASLSWPAIMAQLSTILMEYIDASMVGSLGASASASIGLMATSCWLFWGMGGALATGFSVQVAHLIGANQDDQARSVLRQSMIAVGALGLVLGLVGVGISGNLPHWLGGNAEITEGATAYFSIVMASLPFCYMTFLSSGMLRCSGNMVVPGMLNVAMCVMDVVFNFFLIFPEHEFLGITWPGAGLGVGGAALGTASAEVITGIVLMWFMFRKSAHLNFLHTRFTLNLSRATVMRALKISAPIGAERIMMGGAQVVTTIIVAPIGTVAIAAHAFAITAESLCYMPGYGIGDAATTLTGQSIGAGRKDLTRSFAKITIALGMIVMALMGVVMWVCAPWMMDIFTPDLAVRALGAEVLRIEAWAEPMFAASIVTYGIMVGAGYTVMPACINLGSMWGVRLTLAALLAPKLGLVGVWLAMAIELTVRGTVFLIEFFRGRWVRKASVIPQAELEEKLSDQDLPPFEL